MTTVTDKYNQCTATYKEVDGKMVHDGYFLYGNNQALAWVSVLEIEVVYATANNA